MIIPTRITGQDGSDLTQAPKDAPISFEMREYPADIGDLGTIRFSRPATPAQPEAIATTSPWLLAHHNTRQEA